MQLLCGDGTPRSRTALFASSTSVSLAQCAWVMPTPSASQCGESAITLSTLTASRDGWRARILAHCAPELGLAVDTVCKLTEDGREYWECEFHKWLQ